MGMALHLAHLHGTPGRAHYTPRPDSTSTHRRPRSVHRAALSAQWICQHPRESSPLFVGGERALTRTFARSMVRTAQGTPRGNAQAGSR